MERGTRKTLLGQRKLVEDGIFIFFQFGYFLPIWLQTNSNETFWGSLAKRF